MMTHIIPDIPKIDASHTLPRTVDILYITLAENYD